MDPHRTCIWSRLSQGLLRFAEVPVDQLCQSCLCSFEKLQVRAVCAVWQELFLWVLPTGSIKNKLRGYHWGEFSGNEHKKYFKKSNYQTHGKILSQACPGRHCLCQMKTEEEFFLFWFAYSAVNKPELSSPLLIRKLEMWGLCHRKKPGVDGHKPLASPLYIQLVVCLKMSILVLAQHYVCTGILLLHFEWKYPNILCTCQVRPSLAKRSLNCSSWDAEIPCNLISYVRKIISSSKTLGYLRVPLILLHLQVSSHPSVSPGSFAAPVTSFFHFRKRPCTSQHHENLLCSRNVGFLVTWKCLNKLNKVSHFPVLNYP